MQTEPDPHLEQIIHDALKQLPQLTAPHTLMPRVLAAIEARAPRGWWRQAWWHWPLAAQAGFIALALAVVGLLAGGGVWLGDGVSAYSQQTSERIATWTGGWPSLDQVAGQLSAFVTSVNPSLYLYGLVILAALYLLTLGLGTVCYQLALKRS